MADEASNVTLLGNRGDPVEYIVAAGTAIPKGSLMRLATSPQTALISSADGQVFVGIAAVGKSATDLVTKMACLTNVIADLKATAGGMTLGDTVKIAGVNQVTDQDETSIVKIGENVGVALETVGASGTGAVRIKC